MRRGARGGFGWGWRNQFNATGLRGWQRAAVTPTAVTPVAFTSAVDRQQIVALKEQTESLQKTLNQMQMRIEELETRPKQE
jgi:hypothetical protein